MTRSSRKVEQGLWCLRATLSEPGSLHHRLPGRRDARPFDTFSADVMLDTSPGKPASLLAAVYVEDARGHRCVGDYYPITSRWQTVPLDLRTAEAEGVELDELVAVGVGVKALHPAEGSSTVDLQTDNWLLRESERTYTGSRATGPAKSFYAARTGGRLMIGQVDQWEVTFHRRAAVGDLARPWLEITRGKARDPVLGEPGTGLMILDQDQFDALTPAIQRGPITAASSAESGRGALKPPARSWPLAEDAPSLWNWRVEWTSPVAALVEVRQMCGPFDRLARPAATLVWKFAIYQSGQIYVHAEWTRDNDTAISEPVSWALVTRTPAALAAPGAATQPNRLLEALYPPAFRDEVMPHQMQTDNPLAMLAKTAARDKNLWWWAQTQDRRIFGVGLAQSARKGPLDCLLLVGQPNALTQAAAFSQYLSPPALKFKRGVLDRTFPGDRDNDGFVETYGFQAVRLASGQAHFTIDPENRPLYYPAYLFTVPAAEREDLKGAHVLVNLDGKQFTDPPQWPDGSFLLQLPHVIARPVQVEVTLVKK